jgi:methyltransferase-like protein/2-polyprenyl-3-methyl-5-hydroxy-6-metoxy-1,4-benzoquinol methylase
MDATAANNAKLQAEIARTALKYDLMPYHSKPFAQSQPARLGGIAKLFGLDVVPMAKARVLELGCASGGNIIPLAVRYPKAKFVGMDLGRTQVATGLAKIAQLKLKNIDILCQSLTEIGEELGQFDYIICHGVYSWVPQQVQDAILRVIKERLSPDGLACVSYNALPGWRVMQPMRDAFTLMIPDGDDQALRVARARELLEFIKTYSPDRGPYGDTMRNGADRLAGMSDDYIAHEFLEDHNSPSYLREFANNAAGHSLVYLGDCEFSSMILDNQPPELARQVLARANNDMVETEQMLDVLTGRTFRQTILVGSNRHSKIQRAIGIERLNDLHFVGSAGMKFEENGGGFKLVDNLNRTLSSSSPAVRQGLDRLVSRFPASSTLADCAKGMDAAGRTAVTEAIYRMVMVGMLFVQSEPIQLKAVPGAKPVAFALARADAAAGSAVTTNPRHETVTLDAATQVLLPALDGSRDMAALAAVLLGAGKTQVLNFSRDGKVLTEASEMKEVIAELLPQMLKSIAYAGLLAA